MSLNICILSCPWSSWIGAAIYIELCLINLKEYSVIIISQSSLFLAHKSLILTLSYQFPHSIFSIAIIMFIVVNILQCCLYFLRYSKCSTHCRSDCRDNCLHCFTQHCHCLFGNAWKQKMHGEEYNYNTAATSIIHLPCLNGNSFIF